MQSSSVQACTITAAGADLNATLPLLSTYLIKASTNYTDTRPCIDALIAHLLHINITVIVLPTTLSVGYILTSRPTSRCRSKIARLGVTRLLMTAKKCVGSCHLGFNWKPLSWMIL